MDIVVKENLWQNGSYVFFFHVWIRIRIKENGDWQIASQFYYFHIVTSLQKPNASPSRQRTTGRKSFRSQSCVIAPTLLQGDAKRRKSFWKFSKNRTSKFATTLCRCRRCTRKNLHGCTTTFLPVSNGMKS